MGSGDDFPPAMGKRIVVAGSVISGSGQVWYLLDLGISRSVRWTLCQTAGTEYSEGHSVCQEPGVANTRISQ